ncbi:MAG: alanine racemase [Candidatus Paceibacterota bacterium]
MLNPLTWLSRQRFPYEPLVRVEISRSRLLHNLEAYLALDPENKIAPVVKSNAYGHGLLEVAKILDTANRLDPEIKGRLPFLVIDSYFEAIALTAKKIRLPLLIIGYTSPEIIKASKTTNISYTIANLQTLKAIAETTRLVRIHLKFNTGMNRQGLEPEEFQEALTIIQSNSKIKLIGICSHLCDAANLDPEYTHKQITTWSKLVALAKKEMPTIKYFHLSATDGHWYAGIRRPSDEGDPSIFHNVTRLGLGLYGLADFETEETSTLSLDRKAFIKNLDLQPALELKTSLTSIRKLKTGQVIGYDKTFKASKEMTIATIPVGYYEGLDRRLSNIGSVIVNDEICPIVGLISMNIACIDISAVSNPRIGQEVTVISSKTSLVNSVANIAKLCKTAAYEIVVHVAGHLKRVVVE